MTDVNTQWRTLETANGPMRLYAAYPEQPATRAVVVLQEAFGVNSPTKASLRPGSRS